MPQSFNPCLINQPTGDPGLFISFSFRNRAALFDLGDIDRLSSRDILKITHIFVSHTHMDHFIGFDRLLRIILGREKTIYLYGPQGFLKNIEGKLAGYSWNLVDTFSNQLIFHATEITEKACFMQEYTCATGFKAPRPPLALPPHSQVIHEEPSFTITTAILDHGLPCLGFALEEKFRINIRKDVLAELGLVPGPWLSRFKQNVFENHDPESMVEVPCTKCLGTHFKIFRFKDLVDRLTIVTKGQKIGYVADVAYTPSNVDKIIDLVSDADHLFIESAFLGKDKAHATAKKHLTAEQAGKIAGAAGVKRFTLFHFSPRYQDAESAFYDEALNAYESARNADLRKTQIRL